MKWSLSFIIYEGTSNHLISWGDEMSQYLFSHCLISVMKLLLWETYFRVFIHSVKMHNPSKLCYRIVLKCCIELKSFIASSKFFSWFYEISSKDLTIAYKVRAALEEAWDRIEVFIINNWIIAWKHDMVIIKYWKKTNFAIQ